MNEEEGSTLAINDKVESVIDKDLSELSTLKRPRGHFQTSFNSYAFTVYSALNISKLINFILEQTLLIYKTKFAKITSRKIIITQK